MTIEIIFTAIMVLFAIGIFAFCWHIAAERERQRKLWYKDHHFNHDWTRDDPRKKDFDELYYSKLDEKAFDRNHTWID